MRKTDLVLWRLHLLLALATVQGCGESQSFFGVADSTEEVADAGFDVEATPEVDDEPDATLSDEETHDEPDVVDLDQRAEDEETAEPPPIPPQRPEISSDRVTALQSQLDGIFADGSLSGSRHTAMVVDAESGRVLYESEPDLALVPASNTKLFTTAAALALLGEDYRFRTRVLATADWNSEGVLEGDLILLSEHDISFSDYFYPSARFPMDWLAARLHELGLRAVQGDVIVSGELTYDGHRFNYYDGEAHRQAGLTAFAAALEDAGVSVATTSTSRAFIPPLDAIEKVTWRSVPLYVACSAINSPSHNEFADSLVRHLGYVFADESSYAAGTGEIIDWLASEEVDVEGLSLNDGSGLSHDNRVSARHVINLHQYMSTLGEGELWRRSMSIAGVRGTLAGRLTGEDTVGRVWGKTGTLSVAIATSGTLFNKFDGRRYLFSFLINEHAEHSAARAVENRAVEALAVNMLGLEGRPTWPEVAVATPQETGGLVRWGAVDDALGYYLWRSSDGRVWHRREALYTEGTEAELQFATSLYFRLTAVNESGESDASNVYFLRAGFDPELLLVDGIDRWRSQPTSDNPLGEGNDFIAIHAESGSVPFVVSTNEAVAAGQVDLSEYPAVVWASGEDSQINDSLNSAEQTIVATYLDGGGALFLSGAEIGWDLVEKGEEGEASFFETRFGADYVADDAATYLVEGHGIFSTLELSSFYTPDGVVASYPDVISARESDAVLSYVGGTGGTAAVHREDAGQVILLGFPFEAIESRSDRHTMMDAVLETFGVAL